jgi:hypothetical protein
MGFTGDTNDNVSSGGLQIRPMIVDEIIDPIVVQSDGIQ